MAKNACNVAIEQEAETKKFGLGMYLLVAIRISRTSKIREETVINCKILFLYKTLEKRIRSRAAKGAAKYSVWVHCSPLELVSFVPDVRTAILQLEILFKTTGT